MRTQITFAASIATLALLTACTKERLEPMTAVPEARTTITTGKPGVTQQKLLTGEDRFRRATEVDRTNGVVTSSATHSFTTATEIDRTNGVVTSSAVRPFTTAREIDRTNGTLTGSGNGSGGVAPVAVNDAGVCWYCWQTGLAAYPDQVPVRLLESDDPVRPAPRVHISGEFLPEHANTPTTVMGRVGREIPDNETLIRHTPTVKGEEVGVSISDDGSQDE